MYLEERRWKRFIARKIGPTCDDVEMSAIDCRGMAAPRPPAANIENHVVHRLLHLIEETCGVPALNFPTMSTEGDILTQWIRFSALVVAAWMVGMPCAVGMKDEMINGHGRFSE
jgi:hypothetical protein